MKPQRKVKSPALHHREPLSMPQMSPQPLRTISRGTKAGRRIASELHPPTSPAGHLLGRLNLFNLGQDSTLEPQLPSLGAAMILGGGSVAGGSPPLVAANPEVVVQSGGDDGVERIELGSSGFRELLHV